MFSPASGSTDLSSGNQDYVQNRTDVPSESITFKGCNSESDVGQSPSGSLLIDSISTPLAIKNSGNFYVTVYKDANLSVKIADIIAGVYVEATNLEPGTITDITMTPEDYAVQKEPTLHLVLHFVVACKYRAALG